MHERASRAGMQELTVRAMLHGARLGSAGDAEAAVLLGGSIDNPLWRAGGLSWHAPPAPYSHAGARIAALLTGPSPRNASTRRLSQRS